MAIERRVALTLTLGAERFRRGLELSNGALGKFASSARSTVSGIGRGMKYVADEFGGLGALGAGVGLGVAAKQVMDFDHNLTRLGVTSGATPARLELTRRHLHELASPKQTGQGLDELREALDQMVTAGMDLDKAEALLKAVGRAATSADADVSDMAATALELSDKLNIPTEGLSNAFEIIAAGGKAGSFELKHFAAHFASLGGAAKALGIEGPKGVAQLISMLQIATRGQGVKGQAEAANNLLNFLNKVTAESKDLKDKLGVDIFAGIDPATGRKRLKDIDVILQEIVTKSKGDITNIQKVFQDAQVLAFIRPLIAGFEDYKKIRDDAGQAKGVVDKDYATMIGTAKNQLKALNTEVQKFADATLAQPIEDFKALLAALNEYPNALKAVFGVAAGGAALLGGIAIGGKVVGGVRGLVGAVRGKGGAAEAAAGALGAGIQKVYVTNFPIGMYGEGDSTDLSMFGKKATGAGEATLAARLMGVGKTGVGALATGGATGIATLAGGAALAGAAGYGVGTVVNHYMGEENRTSVQQGIASVIDLFFGRWTDMGRKAFDDIERERQAAAAAATPALSSAGEPPRVEMTMNLNIDAAGNVRQTSVKGADSVKVQARRHGGG